MPEPKTETSAGHSWYDQPFWLTFSFGVVISSVTAGLLWPFMVKTADATYYVAIAEGRWNEVFSPFSKRLLHPLLARLLTHFGVSLDAAFRIWAVLGLVLFFLLLALLLKRTGGTSAAIVVYIASPAIAKMFTDYYMCDLLHACLTAVYLIVLSSRYRLASAMLLPVLLLARESSIVLAIIVIIVALVRRYEMLATTTFIGLLVGLILSATLSARGGANIHHIPDWLYYVLKIPNNIAWNVMGLRFWTNTQIAFNPCKPIWTVELPRGWPTGSIKTVGYCFFDATIPVRNACTIMGIFGILPVLIMLRPRQFRLLQLIKAGDLIVCVAAVYGSVALFVSILGGNDVARYATYAWPLFFISLPVVYRTTPTVFWRFALVANVIFTTLLLTWGHLGVSARFELAATVAVVLTTYAFSLRMMARQLRPELAASLL